MDELVELLNQLIEEARSHLRTLHGRIESLPIIFQPILGRLRELWGQINQEMEEFLKDAAYVVAHHAPLAALLVQSFNWLNNVKSPISTVSATAGSSNGNENIAHWDGAAKDTYDEKKGEQTDALDQVTIRASFVSEWLSTIHTANIEYVTEVLRQLTALVGDLVTVAIDTATMDLPIAIGDLSAVIGGLVENRLNDYIVVGERFVEAGERLRETLSAATDNGSLPHGKWPQAVN